MTEITTWQEALDAMTATNERDEMIKINVYKSAGKWFGARWIDGEHDGCDELDCESEAEALALAAVMPLVGRADDEPREVERAGDT